MHRAACRDQQSFIAHVLLNLTVKTRDIVSRRREMISNLSLLNFCFDCRSDKREIFCLIITGYWEICDLQKINMIVGQRTNGSQVNRLKTKIATKYYFIGKQKHLISITRNISNSYGNKSKVTGVALYTRSSIQ